MSFTTKINFSGLEAVNAMQRQIDSLSAASRAVTQISQHFVSASFIGKEFSQVWQHPIQNFQNPFYNLTFGLSYSSSSKSIDKLREEFYETGDVKILLEIKRLLLEAKEKIDGKIEHLNKSLRRLIAKLAYNNNKTHKAFYRLITISIRISFCKTDEGDSNNLLRFTRERLFKLKKSYNDKRKAKLDQWYRCNT